MSVRLLLRRNAAHRYPPRRILHPDAFEVREGFLDRPYGVWFKDGGAIDGPGYGLFPRPEHLLHLAPCLLIDHGVCLHKSFVEITAEKQVVGRANIFDN